MESIIPGLLLTTLPIFLPKGEDNDHRDIIWQRGNYQKTPSHQVQADQGCVRDADSQGGV